MPWMRYKSGGRMVHRRNCRHCQILDEYRAAQDAWQALRESGADSGGRVPGTAGSSAAYHQLSDEEFASLYPPPRLKDWLIEKGQEWRGPGAA